MLVVRLGEITAPIKLDCELCKVDLPARDPVYTLETEVIHELDENQKIMKVGIKGFESEENEITNEFITLCRYCFEDVKKNAMRFKLPIEWDVVPDGVRLAQNLKVKDF